MITKDELVSQNKLVDQKQLDQLMKLMDELKDSGVGENTYGLMPSQPVGIAQRKRAIRLHA